MNNNMEFKNDLLIKLATNLEINYMNQKKVESIIDELFCDYNVFKIETSLTVSDIGEKVVMFLQAKKLEGKAEGTIQNYFYFLRKLANFSNKQVKDITLNDLRGFISKECSGLQQTTINNKIESIQNFFRWLKDEEIIDTDPSRKLPVVKIPKKLRQSLTLEEVEKLRLACIDTRERAIIEFLFGTGCRVSEAISINIKDLDMHENKVLVIGKGSVERHLFFNEKTRLHINNYLNERKDNNEALFVSKRKPYERIGRKGMQKIINKIGERAGFDKTIFPHLFRHTFATLGLKNGASMSTLQSLLGHSSIATTQRYAETNLENVRYEYDHHMIQ